MFMMDIQNTIKVKGEMFMNKLVKIVSCAFYFALFICGLITSALSYNDGEYFNCICFIFLALLCGFYAIDLLFRKDYERIKIVYHSDIDKIKRITTGDWIDLRSAEDIELKKGEFKLIDLGVSMKLPDGYEAHIAPRSSTYKNFKIIQANSVGVVDNSYCGTNDVWKYPVIAMEDTVIHKNDRICQFRIVKSQPEVHFIETDKLDDTDRGGIGSTGVN